jgi:predicted RNase H-like nuclease (RuvC/YqgF family)
MEHWNEVVLPTITAFFASAITWIFGRKKAQVEVEAGEITNVQEAIKIWREMATDMKAEVAELKEKIELLTTEVHTLRSENVDLRLKLEGKPNESNKSRRKGPSPDKEV